MVDLLTAIIHNISTFNRNSKTRLFLNNGRQASSLNKRPSFDRRRL